MAGHHPFVLDIPASCQPTLKVDFSWVEQGYVSRAVETQGDCSVCWAHGSVKAAEAALNIAGKATPPLSIQYAVDFAYPEKHKCVGAPVAGVVELIRQHGIPAEQDYEPYTGIKNDKSTPRQDENCYKIGGWSLIKDEENQMLAALSSQPLIVSIPMFYYTGEGLIDVIDAEQYVHDYEEEKEAHTVLLIGHGTCYLKHSYKDLHFIRFWIVKNQWSAHWGKDGFGYLIFNSSKLAMKQFELGKALTPKEVERDTWYFSPVAVYGDVSMVPEALKVKEISQIQEMLNLVTSSNYQNHNLVFYLYYSTLETIDKDRETFTQISRLYEYEDEYILAMYNVDNENMRDEIKKLFNIGRKKSTVVAFHKAKSGKQRKLRDGKIFRGSYSFSTLVDWLGAKAHFGKISQTWRSKSC